MATLFVFRDADPVGRLSLDEKGEQGRFVFQYAPDWLSHPGKFPISIRLPLRREPFDEDKSRPFFAGLLPEGDVRRMLTAQFGLSPGNDFGLLEEIGGDCAGALSLFSSDKRPVREGLYRPLPVTELQRRLDQTRPYGSLLLLEQDGVRLSLAGVQNKLPVFWKDGAFFLPEGSFASSHILKPAMPGLEDTAHNEGFCMTLARRAGLPCPEVRMMKIGEHWCCLIERFDREAGEDGVLRRLHQEDFCQASGFLPDRKYEAEGGPGFDACFRMIESKSRRPAADKKAFIQWTVFNALIGNADAHAKNAAFLISETGVRLAPFYDLLCTAAYPGLSKKLSMRIGEAASWSRLTKESWMGFAQTAGIKFTWVAGILKETVSKLAGEAQQEAEAFIDRFGGDYLVKGVASEIKGQCASLLSMIS